MNRADLCLYLNQCEVGTAVLRNEEEGTVQPDQQRGEYKSRVAEHEQLNLKPSESEPSAQTMLSL